MGKGEIARYEQCLLSSSVFKRLALQTRKKPGLVWKRVKMQQNECNPTIPTFNDQEKEVF